MRRSRSPHVSHVTRADDEGNGPAEFMCHMWMRERPPPMSEPCQHLLGIQLRLHRPHLCQCVLAPARLVAII